MNPPFAILRREFFVILGVGAAGAENLLHTHHPAGAKLDFVSYQPRALSHTEYELVDTLAETLLPADETGPGAHAAHVAYYIDVVLTHAPAEKRESWKALLAHIEKLPYRHDDLLAELTKNELNPQTETDALFVELKRTVIEAFYASDLIQREHLGYKGNTAIAEFPGCTHSNFQHPDIGG